MRVQIRRNIFETNSSSMHSISMIGGDKYTEKESLNVKEGFIEVEGGEYGWSGPTCRTPQEKLDYIVTMIESRYGGVVDEDTFAWLSEMVQDYTGYPLRFVGGPYSDMYIDHQSTETLDDYFSWDKEEFQRNMKELVFNEKYSIIISNDNSYF